MPSENFDTIDHDACTWPVFITDIMRNGGMAPSGPAWVAEKEDDDPQTHQELLRFS